MSERPSSFGLLLGQTQYQNKIFFRNPLAAFFTLFFPLMIFVVFALVFGNQEIDYLGVTTAQYYAPSMAVFAAVSATYTNLAVTTAYQRDQGILKRVRGTPLPSAVYMGGKIISAVMIATIAVLIMMVIGVVFYGVQIYAATLASAIMTFIVGVASFAALGLLVAAVVSSGEAATAVTNATLLPLAFFSGVFIVPSQDSPAWLDAVASFFPLKHFVEPFVSAFNPLTVGSGWNWVSLAYMVLWGLVAVFLAVRFFKWEAPTGGGGRSRRKKKASAAS
ncbi:MAG: ABC transporter permease [Acidimicrobiia bacterium]|nr:MAG: ABC transporter permease [Acidimicrobiia bacterium]